MNGSQFLQPEVLKAVAQLELRAKFIAQGYMAGKHRGLTRGFSSEFAAHRRYIQGDCATKIDWTATARAGKVMVREYNADSAITGTLILDTSRSMGYGPPPTTKLDYAVNILAGIGYVMAAGGDAVGLLKLGGKTTEGLKASTQTNCIARVLESLQHTTPTGGGEFAESLIGALPMLRKRGVVVLASDFYPISKCEDYISLFSQLRSRGHDLLIFQILDPDEISPPFVDDAELLDLETNERAVLYKEDVQNYIARVESWRSELRRGAEKVGASFCALTTELSYEQALNSYIKIRSGH